MLNMKSNEQTKEINALNKNIESKANEIDSLNDTILNITTRLTETKLKLDS